MRGNEDEFAPERRGQLAEPGQHQSRLIELSRDTRKNGTPSREDRDALLEAKDRTIARLKERVALLHRDLERKNNILLRMAESLSELLPAPASEVPVGPATVVAPRREADDWAREAQQEPQSAERPALPNGYRVVATASDAWVLVAPRGLRVAGYRGELDLRKVALDARQHQCK